MKNEALKQAREIVAHANGIDGHDYSHVLDMIDAALAQPEQRKSLTKDYTAEDLQNALDRGREIGRSERKPLTDEQIAHATAPVFMGGEPSLTGIARAIEAAHGIKGEA